MPHGAVKKKKKQNKNKKPKLKKRNKNEKQTNKTTDPYNITRLVIDQKTNCLKELLVDFLSK